MAGYAGLLAAVFIMAFMGSLKFGPQLDAIKAKVEQLRGAADNLNTRFDKFNGSVKSTATSLAALTYIGFDGVTTLAEEVREPRRTVPLATVLVCLITGLLSTAEVYLADRVLLLSRRPARIADFTTVDVARPRADATLSDPEFVRLKAHCLEVFQREVRRT